MDCAKGYTPPSAGIFKSETLSMSAEPNEEKKQRRQQSPTKGFVATVNGYDDDMLQELKEFAESKCSYAVIAKEVGANGNEHLQCDFQLKAKTRWPRIRSYLPAGTHIERRRGTARQSIAYCKKGEQPHDEWVRAKEAGPNYGKNADVWECGTPPKPGKRTDLAKLGVALIGGADMSEVVHDYTASAIKYTGGIRAVMAVLQEERAAAAMAARMSCVSLRGWQKAFEAKLKRYLQDKEDRKVLWVYDQTGGHGKSWMARYLAATCCGQQIPHGKFADMAFLLKEKHDVVIIDVPFKVLPADMPYEFMEKVRDGSVFSPKYTPVLKQKVDPWQVVVLSNSLPADNVMAKDRFDIMVIDKDGNVVVPVVVGDDSDSELDLTIPVHPESDDEYAPYVPSQLSVGRHRANYMD